MPKPTAEQITKDVSRLETERFGKRNERLQQWNDLRFRKKAPKVPPAYADTAIVYTSPALQEEGRQVFALVDAKPVPHLIPPVPEDQPLTTKMEKFLMASHDRLEYVYGAARAKVTMGQIHEAISGIKYPMKRAVYKNAPRPKKTDDPDALLEFDLAYERYKRDVGIEAVFEYHHVPTLTRYVVGDIHNPLAVYEVKQIDEHELMLQHYLTKVDGKYQKLDTTPPGMPTDRNDGSRKVKVIEYWDRQWCLIVIGSGVTEKRLMGMRTVDVEYAYELDAWEHKWGEVPYAFAPAFENETLQEEDRFESPLNGVMAELEMFNALMTMYSNVGHLTGYPSWQKQRSEDLTGMLDATTSKKTTEKYQPGMIYELDPGDKIDNLPMNTGSELRELVALSLSRIQQYSVASIARGISPGADTANSAIAQLRRQLKSSLDPMVANQTRMWRRMYQFMLNRLKESDETHYVYDAMSDRTLELSPADIVTVNVQVRQTPEAGTDLLIEEKQAAELTLQSLITPIEFHERRGKENPEEFVLAQTSWELFTLMKPQLLTQVLAGFGDSNAIAQLMAANQETGDAKTAIPGIMEQLAGRQNGETGVMGSGSGGMPRDMGVRSPALQGTTQPTAETGF